MKGCTVYSSQNQECSRLRKWEGESIFKVLTVTRSYIQIYPRRQFSSPSAFPFNSAVKWVLPTAWGNAYFLAKHVSQLEASSTCSTKNDPRWKRAELQKDSSELPLQSKLSLICRECFPCFLLILKTGLGLLQNAVFSVTCIRFQSSSQAHPLAMRVSTGLCISKKAEVTSLGPNGYFRG